MSLVILGSMEVDSEDLETVVAAVRELATATQSERGCRHYAFAQDVLSPQIIRVSEWWEDEESLLEHFQQKHIADFMEFMKTVKIIANEATKYQVSSFGDVM